MSQASREWWPSLDRGCWANEDRRKAKDWAGRAAESTSKTEHRSHWEAELKGAKVSHSLHHHVPTGTVPGGPVRSLPCFVPFRAPPLHCPWDLPPGLTECRFTLPCPIRMAYKQKLYPKSRAEMGGSLQSSHPLLSELHSFSFSKFYVQPAIKTWKTSKALQLTKCWLVYSISTQNLTRHKWHFMNNSAKS